jgi:hypothetical protein
MEPWLSVGLWCSRVSEGSWEVGQAKLLFRRTGSNGPPREGGGDKPSLSMFAGQLHLLQLSEELN